MKWMNECVCECEYEYSSRAIHIDQNWWCWHELWTRRNEAMTLRSAYDRFPPLLFSLAAATFASSSSSSSSLWLCGSEEFPCTRNWLNDFRKWFGYPKHISSESITLLDGPRSVDGWVDETRLERLQVEVIDFEWVGFGHDINIIIKVSINDTLAICLPSSLPPAILWQLIEELLLTTFVVNNMGQVSSEHYLKTEEFNCYTTWWHLAFNPQLLLSLLLLLLLWVLLLLLLLAVLQSCWCYVRMHFQFS